VAVTQQDARTEAVLRYVEAYRQYPENDEDQKAARQSARRTLKLLPWDDR
jgi:hypothetical protein